MNIKWIIFFGLTIILLPGTLALPTHSCGSTVALNQNQFLFQSPNYPLSLGNESFSCDLRISHTPTVNDDGMLCSDPDLDQDGISWDSGTLEENSNAICQVSSKGDGNF
jgi:hypothetical protein